MKRRVGRLESEQVQVEKELQQQWPVSAQVFVVSFTIVCVGKTVISAKRVKKHETETTSRLKGGFLKKEICA